MLSAYYSKGCDSRKLFENLKVGKFENTLSKRRRNPFEEGWDTRKQEKLFEKELNKYDTLYLDIQGIIGRVLSDEQVQKELDDFYEKLPYMSSFRKKAFVTRFSPPFSEGLFRISAKIRNMPIQFRQLLDRPLVGINYEKGNTDKTHSCRIEKVYK